MKIVVDSSTLISLARINALHVLEAIRCGFLCPSEVYEECVIEGLQKGRVDAVVIKRLFDNKKILTKKTTKYGKFPGLSETDCKVLSLGLTEKAAYVFTNDTKLARRMTLQGLEVRGSPDILLRTRNRGALSDNQYLDLIQALHSEKRLSKDNMERYKKRGEKCKKR